MVIEDDIMRKSLEDSVKMVLETDVLIVGAGIAGISAALAAKRTDPELRVMLISGADICSGSSFYPGAFGLGIIGPVDPADEKDLAAAIMEVGCGLADPALVNRLVRDINSRIDDLIAMGVSLITPRKADDDSLVACFDHKIRRWSVIEFDSAKEVFLRELRLAGVDLCPFTEIVQLYQNKEGIAGVLGLDRDNELLFIRCTSVVLATGGFGGLYDLRLNTNDIQGMGLALALEAGCELLNLEFMQFIPGYINPAYKTICAERSLKYAVFLDSKGNDVIDRHIPKGIERSDVFRVRCTHGPFTSRLESRWVDIALFKEYLRLRDSGGITIRYDREKVEADPGQLMQEYFSWLKRVKHLSIDQEFSLAPFFHAANGGIRIGIDAATGVPGLFAAGEVTGGMHGADRIGGLSSANGLVFGTIAGEHAAQYTSGRCDESVSTGRISTSVGSLVLSGIEHAMIEHVIEDASNHLQELRRIMYTYGGIVRTREGLSVALEQISRLSDSLQYRKVFSPEDRRNSYLLRSGLLTAQAVLQAMLLREESRGSHYREDYPNENPSLARPIFSRLNDDLHVWFGDFPRSS